MTATSPTPTNKKLHAAEPQGPSRGPLRLHRRLPDRPAVLPRHRPGHRRPAPGRAGRRGRRRDRRRTARRSTPPGERTRRRTHGRQRRIDPALRVAYHLRRHRAHAAPASSASPCCAPPGRRSWSARPSCTACSCGIGVTIALAQLHIVLGGTPQSSAVANVLGLPNQLADLHPVALGVSVLTLLVLFSWPRLPGRTGHALRKVAGGARRRGDGHRVRRPDRPQPAPGGPAVLAQPRPARAPRGPGPRHHRRRPDRHPGRQRRVPALRRRDRQADRLRARYGKPPAARRPQPGTAGTGRGEHRLRRAGRAARSGRGHAQRGQRQVRCRQPHGRSCCTASGWCSRRDCSSPPST